jgi:hypothetical protein
VLQVPLLMKLIGHPAEQRIYRKEKRIVNENRGKKNLPNHLISKKKPVPAAEGIYSCGTGTRWELIPMAASRRT